MIMQSNTSNDHKTFEEQSKNRLTSEHKSVDLEGTSFRFW